MKQVTNSSSAETYYQQILRYTLEFAKIRLFLGLRSFSWVRPMQIPCRFILFKD